MNIEALCIEAQLAYKSGNASHADAVYSRILESDPAHFEANHILGIIRAQQGRFGDALTLMDTALKTNPYAAEAWRHRGNVLKGLGREAEANASYEKAQATRAEFMPLYSRAGQLHEMRQLNEALTVIDRALLIGPYSPEAWNSRGSILTDLYRSEEALHAFERALALKPNVPEGLYNCANTLQDLKRYEEALAYYDKALAVRPHFVEAINNRGVTLWGLERFDDAIAHFNRALSMKPDFHKVLNNLGACLCESGRVEEGFAVFRRHAEKVHALSARSGERHLPHRLKHDEEQRAYMAENAIVPRGFHLAGGERLATPAVNPINAKEALTKQWRTNSPQIVVIDDFLTPEALEKLRAFCLGSSVWQRSYDDGYLGAMAEHGLACPLLGQIAEELSTTFPAIFRHHQLRYLWAFKYDSALSGTNVHADEAAVNVNFWITPDDANLDAERGGLVVWDVAAPLDWSFDKFNADHDAMRAFLKDSGAKATTIPYRANRCVIFDSDLFHETDKISFKTGYLNRRINVTLLYGRREKQTG